MNILVLRRYFTGLVVAAFCAVMPVSVTAVDSPIVDEASVTLQIDTLKLVWSDVEANAVGSPIRQEYLREFLQKSAPVLRYLSTNHPAAGGLWTLRAIGACELDEKDLAMAAGIKMQELGVDRSPGELVRKTLAMLNRKGWLKSLREVAAEKAEKDAAEERRIAAEMEASRLRAAEDLCQREAQRLETERRAAIEKQRWEAERAESERKAAAEQQRKEAEMALLAKATENSLGMKFQPVPGTKVLFSVWETRVQDYEFYANAVGLELEKPYFRQEKDHPAVNVSWEDAKNFCQWLSKKEGKTYRLPTDEEWSWAVGIGQREIGRNLEDKNERLQGIYP